MKLTFFPALLLMGKVLFSQSIALNTKNGYAIGKMPAMKKIMLYSGLDATREWKINEFYALNAGLGGASLKFSFADTSGTSVFNKKFFITLPLSVKKYYYLTRRSSAFIQLGIVNNILLYDKKEFYYPGDTRKIKTNVSGYNLGTLFNVGFSTQMSQSNWFFIMTMGGQNDLLSAYKNDDFKIRQNATLLGICFEKKLK